LHHIEDHRDACGVGFIVEESGVASRRVIDLSLQALSRLEHRGGKGFDQNTGDGAGLLVNIPWELGLAETHQSLLANHLRDRVTLRVDGGIQTAHDVVIAAALGAEEYDFGTASLMAIGCVMVQRCHLNNCPVGIATQDLELRKRFKGKPEELATFFKMIAEDIRQELIDLGLPSLEALIGRNDLLKMKEDDGTLPTMNGLDLSCILSPTLSTEWISQKKQILVHHAPIYPSFDEKILEKVYSALLSHGQAVIRERVSNKDRAIGTRLAGEIAFLFGENQFNGTIQYRLRGTAGQSFGAFLTHGLELRLRGLANDHVGKGMSGGLITIRMPRDIRTPDVEHTMIGNVALFGATGGTLFVAGRASERFAVRNSGATTVVEGIGNHGCEYMTRGTVIILGEIGQNFGSGMTGGVAYLYRLSKNDHDLLNTDFVLPEVPTEADEFAIVRQLERHKFHTGSQKAEAILNNWDTEKSKFTKITPKVLLLMDYKSLYEKHVSHRLSLVLNE